VTPQTDKRTDGQTDRIPIANTRSQQYLPVQLSRVIKPVRQRLCVVSDQPASRPKLDRRDLQTVLNHVAFLCCLLFLAMAGVLYVPHGSVNPTACIRVPASQCEAYWQTQ